MRVRFIFAWYDLWIGAFWDRKSRKLYILPLPCIGVVIDCRPALDIEQEREWDAMIASADTSEHDDLAIRIQRSNPAAQEKETKL